MKNKKRVLAVLLIATMILSLAGCTKPDKELYKALEKMEEVTSLETDTEINFQIKGQGFEKSKQLEIEQFSQILNNLKINSKQKSLGNEEQTNMKLESQIEFKLADTIIYLGGIPINISDSINELGLNAKAWVDMDLEESKIMSIISLSPGLMNLVNDKETYKEYIIYDIGKVIKSENEDFDFQEFVDLQKEFQPKIIELTKEIQKSLKPDFKILDLKEEKQINGEKIKVYNLKLDNDTLKALINQFAHSSLENQATKRFIVDYLQAYKDSILDTSLDKELKDKIKEMEGKLEEDTEEIKEELNKLMTKLKDIEILGEEGINIQYSINKDGYIVNTKGIIDLRLDLAELAKNMEKDTEQMQGTLNLRINYNTENTNINNKDLQIKFPNTNEENSIDFLDMLKVKRDGSF